ncbi:MAG: SCO family protein [Hyphomicrobiales bacterium]|nr:SCO family protein [Hyphomicrobiales bacterium]
MTKKRTNPSPLRLLAWAAIAVLVGGLGALTIGWYRTEIAGDTGGLLSKPVATIGGPFELVDTEGRTVTDKDLLGKPRAMFFGFTYCPDVCPTTLWEASQWLEALGEDAEKLRFVYVTVDPERDTPQQMKDYLSAFDSRIVGLSGSRPQIDQVIKAYRVYAKRVALDGDDYTMDHTATVYLMNGKGEFVGTVAYQEEQESVLKKLRRLIENG